MVLNKPPYVFKDRKQALKDCFFDTIYLCFSTFCQQFLVSFPIYLFIYLFIHLFARFLCIKQQYLRATGTQYLRRGFKLTQYDIKKETFNI